MPLSKIQFGNTGRRNLIINGGMQVAQRATSVTGIGGDAAYKTLDRFRLNTGNTAGQLTMSQSTVTDLPGFANALKLDCTTADTSIAAGEVGILQYRFEGQDIQQIKKGTSSAEPVTVSFYVKGNANATYTLEFEDSDNSFRANSQEFSVTSSWTRVIKTFVADTTGTLDNDANQSMQLNIWFHGGSNYTSGTFASNTWHTDQSKRIGDNANSFFDSTNRTLEITGFQMEVGSIATDFEHRSFQEEMQRCKRYYQHIGYQYGDSIGATNTFNGAIPGFKMGGSSAYYGGEMFPVEMRAIPTLTIYAVVSGTETAGKLIDFNSGADLGSASVARLRANGYNYLSSGTNSAGAVYRSVLDAEL